MSDTLGKTVKAAIDEQAIENDHLTATKLRDILEKQTKLIQENIIEQINTILSEFPKFNGMEQKSRDNEDRGEFYQEALKMTMKKE